MSGRNEIELICSRQGPESSIQLRSALFLSDKMTAIHDLMCQFKPFDVRSIVSFGQVSNLF